MRDSVIPVVAIGIFVFGVFGYNSVRKVELSQVFTLASISIDKHTLCVRIFEIE